jgi:hypothetical protein
MSRLNILEELFEGLFNSCWVIPAFDILLFEADGPDFLYSEIFGIVVMKIRNLFHSLTIVYEEFIFESNSFNLFCGIVHTSFLHWYLNLLLKD